MRSRFTCMTANRDDRENLVCFVLVGLWVLWHLLHGLGCLTEYVSTGIALDDFWMYGIYRTSFSLLGWLTVAGAAIFVIPRLHWRRPWFVFLGLLLLWSAICAAVSGSWQEHWTGTFYRMDGLRSYLFYGAVLLCASRVRKGRLELLRMWAVAAIAEAILVLLQAFEVPGIYEFTMSPLAGTFFQFNHCGYFLTMSILCALGLYLYDGDKKWRAVYLLSLGLSYYALLKNDTFGCQLAVWAGIVIVYILFCVGRSKIAADFLPLAVVGAFSLLCWRAIAYNMTDLLSGIFAILDDPDSEEAARAGTTRFGLWKLTVEFIKQKPVFGWGPDALEEEFRDLTGSTRPHNEYLQYAAFLGIPGLCLYMGGLVSLCVKRLKALRAQNAATLVAGGAVMGYLVSAMFGNTMFYTSPLFFLLLGLVAAEEDEMKGEPCSTIHPE